MTNARDDFTQGTIRTLQERVANHCSNPNCPMPTSGPHTDPQKVSRVGRAAHICAAAPGGKRYDVRMTSEERGDIGNGIWLCASCAGLIDTEEFRYNAPLLQEWKTRTEQSAIEALRGCPRPLVEEVETWGCGHCHSLVPIGATVCFACDAEVVCGSTKQERGQDFQLGSGISAVGMLFVGSSLPSVINRVFDTHFQAFFGLMSPPVFIICGSICIVTGVLFVYKRDQDRKSNGPRFFRQRLT